MATMAICVGATKAGTSFLYEHLAAHPQCHFRTIKELHYFDKVLTGATREWCRDLEAEANRVKCWLPDAAVEMVPRMLRRISDLADWVEVLAKPEIDLKAYCSFLTAGRAGRPVVGEVTPAYVTLSTDVLARIAGMSGDVRIIYLMRDPVARMWSHVRMMTEREKSGSEQFDVQVARKFDYFIRRDPMVQQRGDYAMALAKLTEVVAPGRLLTMFSEDMMTAAGMARLWAFLGIGPGQVNLDRRVHEGPTLAMSRDQRARARVALMPQYRAVARHFPVLPDAWRKSMEEVAA